MKIAVLPGDGMAEIVTEAVKVLKALDLSFEMQEAKVGARLTMPTAIRCRSTLKLAMGSRTPCCLARWVTGGVRHWIAPCVLSRPFWVCARTWACSPISVPPFAIRS